MKLKINKACDLSSISVLPPQSRRPSALGGSGPDASTFGKSQASQLRSQQQQQSQHSFSQGMSSQLSQNSLEEALTNELKFCSQGDNSTRRTSCLAPVVYNREDTPLPMSRSSNNHLRRWGSGSVQDHRCQVSEELEHRIGVIENSLNRFGMVLNSVQEDVMQVNRAIKDVSMETEGIRKKLTAQDSSLQLMLQGEDEIKATLDGSVKCIPDQLRKDLNQYKLQESVSALLSLPNQIGAQLQKIKGELCGDITKELETILISINLPLHKSTSPAHPAQMGSNHNQPKKEQPPVRKLVSSRPVAPLKARAPRIPEPKIEEENDGFINPKSGSFVKRQHNVEHKPEKISLVEQDKVCRVLIESDEEIDVGFSCLLEAKETGMEVSSFDDVNRETQQILRKARRRKRKHCNSIILL